MKTRLFTLLILFFACIEYSKAQEHEFINHSSKYIRDSMKNLGFVLIGTGKNPQGTKKYITFYSNPTNLTFYFDINGDDCLGVLELVPKTSLAEVTQIMNRNYIKTGNLTWMSFDTEFKITIETNTLPKELVIRYTTK